MNNMVHFEGEISYIKVQPRPRMDTMFHLKIKQVSPMYTVCMICDVVGTAHWQFSGWWLLLFLESFLSPLTAH